MRRRTALAGAFLAWAALTGAALAGDARIYTAEMSFDDATFGVESAITNRGLVVDHVSHVGEMLNRTGEAVGATRRVYEQADIFMFCSAVLSRKMMEADPDNIAHCPYGVFVREMPETGAVEIGYRIMPEGEMKEVEALLDAIAREAAGID